MKLTLFVIIFSIFAIICMGIFAYLTYYSYSGENRLDLSTAKELIESQEIKHIIDVRSYNEWLSGHHPKAMHMPVNNVDELKLKHIDKNDKILLYDNTGQRARYASEKLQRLGFENVYYIASSFNGLL